MQVCQVWLYHYWLLVLWHLGACSQYLAHAHNIRIARFKCTYVRGWLTISNTMKFTSVLSCIEHNYYYVFATCTLPFYFSISLPFTNCLLNSLYGHQNFKVTVNIHWWLCSNCSSALQPSEIHHFFQRVCSHAKDLKRAYSAVSRGNLRVPSITVSMSSRMIASFYMRICFNKVYLDEINTSSYLGILKEIITDRAMGGEVCFAWCV